MEFFSGSQNLKFGRVKNEKEGKVEMSKTVTMCTRVEGHGSLRISLQKNEISGVYFEIQAFRGFENILLNKKLIDVPRIVSRVCGLCYASHAITSCRAIESMFELEPSSQSIQLRRLLMIGELINSHSMHFFFQAFPDLFVILKGQSNPLPLSELLQYDRQLTSKMFELIKIGKELITIFGGRSAHPITPIIGGISHAPTKKNIGTARKYVQQALTNIKWVIERYQELFFQDEPPAKFSLGNPTFLAIYNKGKYDRYGGLLQLKQNNAVVANFPGVDYSQHFDWREDIQGALPGIYTVAGDSKLFVGPISRYHIIKDYGIGEVEPYLDYFSKAWQGNLLYSHYLRLIEILAEIYEGLAILENTKLFKPIKIAPLTSIKNKEGVGVVEAPRGTLIHHYHVNDKQLIDNVKLLVATEINIPTINNILTRQSQKLFGETQDLEQVKRQAQIILRSFDPCISCATH